MYAERGPRVTHVSTVYYYAPNIVPDVRNESRKNLVSFLRTCNYCNKMRMHYTISQFVINT